MTSGSEASNAVEVSMKGFDPPDSVLQVELDILVLFCIFDSIRTEVRERLIVNGFQGVLTGLTNREIWGAFELKKCCNK